MNNYNEPQSVDLKYTEAGKIEKSLPETQNHELILAAYEEDDDYESGFSCSCCQ